MPRALARTATAAAALLVLTQPLAALTAEEAWQGWQDFAADFDQTVSTVDETRRGDALVVSGATFTMRSADDEAEDMTLTYTIPEIVFAEQEDGGVEITMSESYDILVAGTDEDGATVAGTMMLSHPGLVVLAQEDGEDLLFAFAGDGFELVSGPFLEDGEPVDLEFAMSAGALSGGYTQTGPGSIVSEFDGEDFEILVAGTDDEGGQFSFEANYAGLSFEAMSEGGDAWGSDALSELLAGGFATEGRIEIGESQSVIGSETPRDSSLVQSTSAGGVIDFALNQDGVRFDMRSAGGSETILSGTELPFGELAFGISNTALNVEVPLGVGGQPQPFTVQLGLDGLTVGDGLWNLFDPAGVLPRDPAALVIAVSGAMRWLVDVTDPAMEDADEPAEITRLDIGQILLSIAGAELSAEGGFSFDYEDRGRFGDAPRPEGGVQIVLTGANRLLDRLVQMGLVQPEEAMTARMMSGMLLRPGEGPDTLVSDIAVSPSGQITANGAPLPF